MEDDLIQVLEALLFSGSEPLSVKTVQAVFARAAEERSSKEDAQGLLAPVMEQMPSAFVAAGRIREAMETLRARLDERKAVCELVEGPEGWQLVLRARFAPWVRLLRDEPAPKRLSASLVETLAVVAYRQPVTRSELEAIRGVSCDRVLNQLTELDLVHVEGRADLPGRPYQYATTTHFLDFCGLGSLEELPASDVISAELLDKWLSGTGKEA